MDKNFEELKRGVDFVLDGTDRPGKKKAAAAILDTWANLRANGIEARDFAEASLFISKFVVTCYDTMPAMLRFAELMKRTADDQLSNLRQSWPNIPSEERDWPKGLHPEKDDEG